MSLRSIFAIPALLLAAVTYLTAQTATDPNEGTRLAPEPSLENGFRLSWWGRSGHSYFIQHTPDLVSQPWQYLPIIETGQNAVLGYGFSTVDPRFFLRLKIADQTAADPYLADFDGDGISNGNELLRFLDPLKYQDTDQDGFPDDWEKYHFDNDLTKAIDDGSDQDGDGVTDWESWLMGVNPNPPPSDRIAPTWSNGSGLSVTNETVTGFTLSWLAATDSSGSVKYQLYRNGQPEGSPATGLSRAVSFTELSGWQRWNVHPVDQAGNHGLSSGAVERYIGAVVDVNLSLRAKSRIGSLAKWGFPPLTPESELAPIVRSFAQRVTTQKEDTEATNELGEPNTSSTDYTKILTESRTPDGSTSEYEGTSEFSITFTGLGSSRSRSGSWDTNGTWSGTETTVDGAGPTTTPLGPGDEPSFSDPSTGSVLVSTATEYEIKKTLVGGYSSLHKILSSPISDQDHEGALISRLPSFETLSWGSSAGASRNWSVDRLSLSLGDSQYKVVIPSTQSGHHYRVRWLEIFYPEAVPNQPPPEPVARAYRQFTAEGTDGEVESEVFTLAAPTADGTVSLLSFGVDLAAPGALIINDDFDERVDDSEDENPPPQPWVRDNETPSPVRADGTLALMDLGEIYPYANNGGQSGSFHPATSSVVLSVTEGESLVRLIAVAPEGSGENGEYTGADWAIIESGTELWGTYYGRKDGEGNARPNWRIYMDRQQERLRQFSLLTSMAKP